jgi:hypothetical protein
MEIDSLEEVRLGGLTQWIRVRGADASNPVLLLMQQGPGLPIINDARLWERLLGLEIGAHAPPGGTCQVPGPAHEGQSQPARQHLTQPVGLPAAQSQAAR